MELCHFIGVMIKCMVVLLVGKSWWLGVPDVYRGLKPYPITALTRCKRTFSKPWPLVIWLTSVRGSFKLQLKRHLDALSDLLHSIVSKWPFLEPSKQRALASAKDKMRP